MAGMSMSVQHRGPKLPRSLQEAFPHRRAIYEAVGRELVGQVRRLIWNRSKFQYRGRRPKPAKSRSTEAWAFRADGDRGELMLLNPVPYVPYVHYAGTPRDAVLVKRVTELGRNWGLKRLRALMRADWVAARRAAAGAETGGGF